MFSQLTTRAQAEAVARELSGFGKPEIFIPSYGGPYSAPEEDDRKFFHLRWPNGFEVNVGLVLASKALRPAFWLAGFALEFFAHSALHSGD